MTDYSNRLPAGDLFNRNHRGKAGSPSCADFHLLRINSDHAVDFSERTYYGNDAVPSSEWRQVDIVFKIGARGCAIDRGSLASDLGEGGVLSLLIDRVVAGHGVEWSGQNHVGRLSEDAYEASLALVVRLAHHYVDASLTLWQAEDYLVENAWPALADRYGLAFDSAPQAVAAAARSVVEEARSSSQVVLFADDVAECIQALATEAREARQADEESLPWSGI